MRGTTTQVPQRVCSQSLMKADWQSRVVELLDKSFRSTSLLPAVVLFVLLTVVPMFTVGRMAMSTIELSGGQQQWHFDPGANIRQLQGDRIFPAAMRNTAMFVVVAVLSQVVLGFALAFAVSRLTKWQGLARTVMLLPMLVPPVAIGSMWRLLYDFDSGPINAVLAALGVDPINWLGQANIALWAVIVVDVWHWTPFVFLLMLAGLESLPRDLFEAAEVDGASQWQVLRRIILPLMMPTIWVVLIFRTIAAFRVFDEILLLTAGGPGTATEVASLYIFKVFFEQTRYGYGAMLSVITVVALFVGLWAIRRVRSAAGGPA